MKHQPLAPVARTLGKSPKVSSPAAESVRDCDKTLDRMGRNWKLAEKAGIPTVAPVVSRPIAPDCFADESRDSQIRAMRGIGRFAGRLRATQHADAMALLSAGRLWFCDGLPYTDAFTAYEIACAAGRVGAMGQ